MLLYLGLLEGVNQAKIVRIINVGLVLNDGMNPKIVDVRIIVEH